MENNSQKNVVEYWIKMQLDDGYSCPNVSFFRFIGCAGISLKEKKVLEIGFGANRGKDLLECLTRGAYVWGVDINKSYVEDFQKKNPEISVAVMNAGEDNFPFPVSYDLIYHRDVVYYLTDDQIKFHFSKSYEKLSDGGYLVFQFIEKDLMMDEGNENQESKQLNFDIFKTANVDKMFRGEVNPLRTLNIDDLISMALNVGFELIATKTHIESYTPNESVFRVDRYLILRK